MGVSGKLQRVILMNRSVLCELDFYSASFIGLYVSYHVQLLLPSACIRRSGPTKTRTEHLLSRWRIAATAATVVVDCLDCGKDLLRTFQCQIITQTMEVQRYLCFLNMGVAPCYQRKTALTTRSSRPVGS